jgi:hypothetical protein
MRAAIEGFANLWPRKSPNGGTNTRPRPSKTKPNIPRNPSSKGPDVGTPKRADANFPLSAPVSAALSAYTKSSKIVMNTEGNTQVF